jgi:N utilization substance protein B
MALNRRKEREIVFQMLFASQFMPEEESEHLYEILIDQMEEPARESEYIRETFFGARSYFPTALEKIEASAKDWKITRLSKGTLTVLSLAIYEMDLSDSVPTKIAINEAVEIAKRFCEDGAKKFVNGILGTLAEK